MVLRMESQHIIYRLACPNCSYKYLLSLFEKYDYEHCPICGHGDSLDKFISKAKIIPKEIAR